MKWKKLGRLYQPEFIHPRLATHASNPLPLLLEDDVYRIFFSGRDIKNRSSVGYVDIDIIQRRVVHVHDKPVFEFGEEDSFYSHGVSIGNCYEVNGQRYILFMGWQCPPDDHWRGVIGRLVLAEDYSIYLENNEAFMSTDAADPVSLSYPWVSSFEKNEYHMWYGSTRSWDAGNSEMLHVINHAISGDGHHWQKKGLAVPYLLGKAQAFSHPTVIRDKHGGLHMWFSCRSGSGETYRIGYARSNDANRWEFCPDMTGIDISENGWDSEMIEYPFVFNHKNRYYMLYNGNGYGRTGFGIAIMEDNTSFY